MNRQALLISLLLAALLPLRRASALDNELARTPPMGWNSWNSFGCNVSADLVKKTADAFVATGMKDAGYLYINIDDCWCLKKRDANGDVVPDPVKFPDGIKGVADYVHSKGLKLGIYSDCGPLTCAGYPGLKDHELQDMKKFAEWGVDYIKVDWCNTKGMKQAEAYKVVGDAIAKCGRPMVYSLCEWGSSKPWEWAGDVGNLWRTTGDISATWGSVMSIVDQQVGLEGYAGPGHWNDPDMMEVGVGKLTVAESRAHFSLWCELASPLLTGTNLTKVKPEVVEILTNKEVIAINQDALGAQGCKVFSDNGLEVWTRRLADNSQSIILLNRTEKIERITISFSRLGWSGDTTATIRDLWAHKDLPQATREFSAEVAPHDVIMVRATPAELPDGNAPPTVKLVAEFAQVKPSTKASSRPGTATRSARLRALPFDRDGKLVKVEVFEGDALLKSFAGGRYTVDVTKPPGEYTFKAVVTDDKGATGTNTITLTISPPAPATQAAANPEDESADAQSPCPCAVHDEGG